MRTRQGTMIARAGWVLAAAACAAVIAACHDPVNGDASRVIAGGNAQRGKAAITASGCGSCHMIPGIDNANGLVGPPLEHWSRRTYIAGEVPNTADFLVRWIEMPQAIEPATAMPNLGITEQKARDMAAYLYTLH